MDIKEKLAFKVEEGKTGANCLMRKSLNNLAYQKWRRSYGEAWETGRDVLEMGLAREVEMEVNKNNIYIYIYKYIVCVYLYKCYNEACPST